MHSGEQDYELTMAPSLEAVLAQLAAEPGRHTPMAGGTELMVAFNAGRLAATSLRFTSVQAPPSRISAAMK